MSWTVVLEDEDHNPIATLSAEFQPKAPLDHAPFRLLGYLDPYGNTTFNCRQIPDLLRDLTLLLSIEPNPVGDELLALVQRSTEAVHQYLCFYGD